MNQTISLKRKKSTPNKLTLLQRELAVDIARFTRKWTTPKLGKAFGVNRQAIEFQLYKEDSK